VTAPEASAAAAVSTLVSRGRVVADQRRGPVNKRLITGPTPNARVAYITLSLHMRETLRKFNGDEAEVIW
jgi:hypothetical protein